MENIIVSTTNCIAIFAARQSYNNKDNITLLFLLFTTLASFFSHLIENHKHGMPGLGFSVTTSYILNKIDVLSCYLLVGRIAYLYYSKYGISISPIIENKQIILHIIISLIFLAISEYDKYNTNLKLSYIITHSLWHINIFFVIDTFFKQYIYKQI